ncbi:hypothetical protein DFS34DRAFT_662514 [Phlyctochytrium arcticum]|nr:hypothetical protein DFS34DRAFT_662514 [Phlyctochytrium arcticum]
MDHATDDLQVYTLQPLPENSQPSPAQASLTGVIKANADDEEVKVVYRVFRDQKQSTRLVNVISVGGWKTRKTVLAKDAVVEFVGELQSLDEVVASNFYMTGATGKVRRVRAALHLFGVVPLRLPRGPLPPLTTPPAPPSALPTPRLGLVRQRSTRAATRTRAGRAAVLPQRTTAFFTEMNIPASLR